MRVVALSGPTHAEEVAKDMPTTIVSASKDLEAAKIVQDAFMNDNMRVYTNEDIKGVEICGALKNVIALASGISSGLGFGDNARAAPRPEVGKMLPQVKNVIAVSSGKGGVGRR